MDEKKFWIDRLVHWYIYWGASDSGSAVFTLAWMILKFVVVTAIILRLSFVFFNNISYSDLASTLIISLLLCLWLVMSMISISVHKRLDEIEEKLKKKHDK